MPVAAIKKKSNTQAKQCKKRKPPRYKFIAHRSVFAQCSESIELGRKNANDTARVEQKTPSKSSPVIAGRGEVITEGPLLDFFNTLKRFESVVFFRPRKNEFHFSIDRQGERVWCWPEQGMPFQEDLPLAQGN